MPAKGLAAAAFLLLGATAAFAQDSVSLATVAPESVRARDPRQQARPRQLSTFVVLGRARTAIQFFLQSEVSYVIPAGQQNFSGTLFYRNTGALQLDSSKQAFNRLRIRFLVDGQQVFGAMMDAATPPIEFSMDLSTGKHLTVVGGDEFGVDSFYLLDPTLSPEKRSTFSRFVLSPGEGYLSFMPLPRQGLFHVYHPQETVSVEASFRGKASQAQVFLRVTPEQGGQVTDSTLQMKLEIAGPDLVRGSATWQLPSRRGPALLEAEERIGGRTVYARQLRIAIAPEVDLAGVSDNTFGVDLSHEGYAFLQDEFASLWGAKWGRVFLRWPIVEATPGNYDFSRADQLIEIYQKQNMRVLGVLGEDAPAWVGTAGREYADAWRRFIEAAVKHFRGRIDRWDVFNEIDVKYFDRFVKSSRDFDLTLLEAGLEAVQSTDVKSKTVCCSTGVSDWLLYDKRIFDAGLLRGIDIVSWHPYQYTAPEDRLGIFDYLGALDALKDLVHSEGVSKPVWSTEANWIIGPPGAPYVTTPELDEHTQAGYVVRVNLLSLGRGVPYFLHMPFFYSAHPQLLLDTLTAYANMSSWFSRATGANIINPAPGVYGVIAKLPNQSVGALWAAHGQAVVSVMGLSNVHFWDFYGNPASFRANSIPLSSSPIYFTADAGPSPDLKLLIPAPSPAWRPLPGFESWERSPASKYEASAEGLHVTSATTLYTVQLLSPPLQVQSKSCYVASFNLSLLHGSLGAFVSGWNVHQRLSRVAYLSYVPDGRTHRVEIPFQVGSEASARIVIQDMNAREPAVSEFWVSNPSIAPCT